MSVPPSPAGLEDGENTGREYEMAAPGNAATGYEYGGTTSDQLGAGESSYETMQQQQQQQRDAPAGDVGDDQYQYQHNHGMQHQPDDARYGSTPDMAGSQQQQQQQQQEEDYGEQQYDERGPLGGYAAGQVDEDEEDAYEDPEEMIREFGRHPMMDRVQEALYNQLLQTYERVSEELRDKDTDVKKLRKRREFVGVELYAMQQQLAKLQVALEQTHADFNGLGEGRARAELDADAAKRRYSELKGVGDALSKRLVKNEAELNSLQDTLRQVELYNEEMKGEILVTRRATYKAEEAVSGLEKDKGRQDLFIDRLMEQVKRLQGQVAVAEAQISMSQGQTGEADSMLRETAHEMSLIAFEKKQLLQQWKGALIGLARRDEALTAASNALKEAQSAARDYDIEIEGLKRETMKAQEEHEGLVAVRDRLESGRVFVKEQLAKTKAERDSLAERYSMLQRSLAQSEEDEEKLDAAGAQLRSQVEMLSNQTQALTRERQKLEAEAAKRKSHQSSMSKAVKNLVRQARGVVEQIHEIEMEEANLQNEQARVRVDSLNTEAHNLQLRETMRRSEEELNSKDRLIEKYQNEIRQRGDEIEKKMYSVDRLNRQYEKLREAVEEPENAGPLEASIKSLRKEIGALGEENSRMKHEWLADQTQLVSSAMETEQLAEKNAELRARASIVGQRKARLLQSVTSDLAESKRLRSAIEGMHMDMGRLNDLIGKSGRRAHELDDVTRALEREFVQELRDLEAESVGLEGRIRAVKDLKAETLEKILEAERQVMLWEKKTQLERETQAALDPGVGKSEVRTMEREIHRMRIRSEGLKREQERMIQEMERAIAKREQIAVRYKGKSEAAAGRVTKGRGGMLATGDGKAGGLGDLTTTALKKKVVSLQRQLNASADETLRYTRAAEDRRNEVGALSNSLKEEAARAEEAARRGEELRSTINAGLYEKQRLAEVTAVKQRLSDSLRGIAKGVVKPVPQRDAMKVEQALLSSEIRLGAARDAVESIAEKFPHLRDVLGRLSRLSEDATG